MPSVEWSSVSGFQFHKGTIKTLFAVIVLLITRNFNSIKVRLKRSIAAGAPLRLPFQFHKGTIKTFPEMSFPLVRVISIP